MATMTTRAMLEVIVHHGYSATVTHHADGKVSVRATNKAGLTLQSIAQSELQAATDLWNKLGLRPRQKTPSTTPANQPAASPRK